MPISPVISKARPDHPSIDFDLLRAEGIRHLEHFATEVWTDYNAHDPGITLLELLCYAITDLGYRTRKLPVEDLLADPDRHYKPWFGAAEVLPTSPVTTLDYRKLLIDIKGVKNAWLLPGNAELGLKSLGIVFPELSEEDFALSPERLKNFLIEKGFLQENERIDSEIKEIIQKINEEKERVEKLEKIQVFISAIGVKSYFEQLIIQDIQKFFKSKGLNINEIHAEVVYRNIKFNPNEQSLPIKPEIIENNSALLDGIKSYELLVTSAINNYLTTVVIVENDPNPAILINYFLDRIQNISASSPEYTVYNSIRSFPLNQSGNEKQRKLNYLLREFIDPDLTQANLNTIVRYYQEDIPVKPYLIDQGFINNYFSIESESWRIEEVVVKGFLDAVSLPYEEEDIANIISHYNNDETDQQEEGRWDNIITYLFRDKFCEHGLWGVSATGGDPLPLSGLYTVLIDLDEHIHPAIANEVNPVMRRVRRALHANRALCEDFVGIHIVEERPINLCLELEVDPEADEVEVFAESIRLMQEYLSPAPRFRSFAGRQAELKAKGKNPSAEHVYNGPLLKNGFLDDTELSDQLPRDKYYHSDLLGIAMSVKGVTGLPALKVKEAPEILAKFVEETEYEVYTGDFATYIGDFAPPAKPPWYKPVIDLVHSKFTVTKGARTFSMDWRQIEERLRMLRLIHATDPLEPPGGPVWEDGQYRPDLGDYRSLQYDLPATYAVGRNSANVPGSPGLKAQNRHLQAYLAFYDQILAAYLAQLGRVRRLLSVDQSADAPTRGLPLLYEVPGIREMIGEEAEFEATPDDWAPVLLHIDDERISIPAPNGSDTQLSDREWVGKLLQDHFGEAEVSFSGFPALREALRQAFSGYPSLRELYAQTVEDYFWNKYIADPNNNYACMLREMAESPAVRQRRRNELLDHLIARFGEAFSEYAVTLLRPEAEPEDNPRQQDFQEFLESKTAFLREVAALALERNRAYNYTAIDRMENVSDVWNSRNVSGLQKRVVRKLGIPTWEIRSLIAEPAYRIDIMVGKNKRGLENYSIALRRRLIGEDERENWVEAVPLMTSPACKSRRIAQENINELYKVIWQAKYYRSIAELPEEHKLPDFYWFALMAIPGGDYRGVLAKYKPESKSQLIDPLDPKQTLPIEILLQTKGFSEKEAANAIAAVMQLVEPAAAGRQNEGFHIVEHILLRPLEANDKLLQIPLGCVPEETPKDPYSFWITVVAPASTARFADPDFRAYFEHEFRMEMPAHIGARFCFLMPDDMYKFEEAFGVWMYEKARCSLPNPCKVDAARDKLVEVLNNLPCSCACAEKDAGDPCE